jgi:hypothetical protein
VIAVLGLGVQSAEADCGGVKHVRPAVDRNPGRAPLAIGDSVLLGALHEVSRAGFEIDTRGCRPMAEGLKVMRARRRARTLPRFVVFALGANSDITAGEIRAALRIAGRRRVVGMVSPTNGGPDRARIRAAARHHRGLLNLDWVAFSRGHGGWFAGDGLHLGRGGAAGLARLLGRGLRRLYRRTTRFSAGRGPSGYAGRPDPQR